MKPAHFKDYKPLEHHSVTEWGFKGEYRKGYIAALEAAAKIAILDGQVSCANADCSHTRELAPPKKRRCKECPQADAEFLAGTIRALKL